MTLYLKQGPNRVRLSPDMARTVMIQITMQVFAEHGKDAIITGCLEGRHSRKSEHYQGNALDWRTRHLDSEQEAHEITATIQTRLGKDFVVIFEADHIHTHWQPNGPLNLS